MLKSPSLAVKRFWEQLVPEPKFEPLIEWGLKSSEKTPPEIFVKSLCNFSKADVRPLLRKIGIPTLIINGDKTPYACGNAKYLKENIPKSKAIIFKGLGLCFLNMKATNKFNEILDSLIDT